MPAYQQIFAVGVGLAVGLVSIVAMWLVVNNGWSRAGGRAHDTDPAPEPVGDVHEYPQGLAEAHGPVTGFLRFAIVGFIVWAIVYIAMFFGLKLF